jgi:hypothetical protein
MYPRAERLAMNEMLFRKVNEQIEEHAEPRTEPSDPIAFYCECGSLECEQRIVMSAHEFHAVRSRPTQFIVRPGHEILDVEVVVMETPPYLVVEKIGDAAEYVIDELDESR